MESDLQARMVGLLHQGADLCRRLEQHKSSGGRAIVINGRYDPERERRMHERESREKARAEDNIACRTWFYSAIDFVSLAVNQGNVYYSECQRLREKLGADMSLNVLIPSMYSLLLSISDEYKHGLLGGPEYIYAIESFEGFLDHAEELLTLGRVKASSVLASIVLEDTIKKLGKRHSVVVEKEKLEQAINALKTKGILKSGKAKQLKACADVRNQALHADFEDIAPRSVRTLIDEVKDLLENYF
jgi:hypothetical protein